MNNKKVFLGGTCNGSNWRDKLINILEIDYFNPVVDDWDEESQMEELIQRRRCDFLLYTLTPKMKGVYSIAELVDDSNKRPHKTILCILKTDGEEEFDSHQLKSINMVKRLIEDNGARSFENLVDVANFLNNL
jgi:hypothetical protein